MADDKFKEPKAKKETSAGLIVYRQTKEGPKFLVMYHRGSYWNFPKGHIEQGEKSLEAALRETTEETGLLEKDLRVKRNFKAHERYQFKAPKGKVDKTVVLYLAETKIEEIKVSYAHDGYGWFLYRDARKLLANHKESLEVLKRAYGFISQGSRRLPFRKETLPKKERQGLQQPS
ncbi:MAG: NUDIX domain-containing protein [bacterium]|nr:NUDIX domain-containing protein [bacterium]MDZ4231465.1 NUDIX domain-containing protein [Patescibacteria group bacterium]